MKKFIAAAALTAVALTTVACGQEASDADVVNHNISVDADQFKIARRIVFFNGITDKYLMTIEGKCSIDADALRKLTVTCKTGENEYKRSYLGLSDNVSYFAEQLEGANVSRWHYAVVFKPEVIVPDVVRP